ncbi:MAG TPA: acyl-CoA dehydrogenase family protein [Acidimicrobiales bacterium]|nr:acyl-CoA dehydrogenase family protein [Acidimicrobiales bacterium]
MNELERDLFARSIRAALESGHRLALEDALDDTGWYEALTAEPRTAISILFELQGESNAGPSLDAVMAWALDPDDPAPAVVLPPLGRWDAPAERHGDQLVVAGMATERLGRAEIAQVGTWSGGRTEIHTIRTAQLEVRAITGMDPVLGLLAVRGTVEVAPAPGREAGDAWNRSIAFGRLGLSHALVGAARRMLELARAHAIERVQFGRSISSFQAVRHRLSDSLVAIEAAEASLAAAWDLGSGLSASVAKAVAGRSGRLVSRHAQQVLAGMGFTAEHPLHRFVRRTLTLDQLLGAATSLTESVGEQLLRSRTLPAGQPL